MKMLDLDNLPAPIKNPHTRTWYRKLKEDPVKYRAYLDRVNDWKRAKKRQAKMQDVIVGRERVDEEKQKMLRKLIHSIVSYDDWRNDELGDVLDMIKIADRLERV